MVKSKVTQREETPVAKSSRKGLEKATCRRKGYGNSEACATAVTLNQSWTGSERSEDVSVCSVGFSLTIQRSRVSEEHCLTMFSLYLLLLSVACALLCWYKNHHYYYYYYYYFLKKQKSLLTYDKFTFQYHKLKFSWNKNIKTKIIKH